MYKRRDKWISDFYWEGKRYTKSWGAISKTVATEKDRKFRIEVMEGKHALRARRIAFEKFAEKYLEHAALHKKPNSVRRNRFSIAMLMPHFEGKRLDSIHPFQVEQYKKTRRAGGVEPATVNRDVATLRNMFNKAVDWGYLSANPLCSVKLLTEDNEIMWPLTPEEEARLLEKCNSSAQEKKYLADLVLFALHSGMREMEIFNLRRSEIDLEKRYIQVLDTKNHEPRKVPINETLKSVIGRQALDERCEYLFSNAEGEKLTVLTNAFWHAVKEAGLTRVEERDGKMRKVRFRFHDLRHSFGTRLGMAGVDLKTIMEIMGHKTPRMAMRYQHPAPSHKLQAVRNLDQVPSKVTTAKVVSGNFGA